MELRRQRRVENDFISGRRFNGRLSRGQQPETLIDPEDLDSVGPSGVVWGAGARRNRNSRNDHSVNNSLLSQGRGEFRPKKPVVRGKRQLDRAQPRQRHVAHDEGADQYRAAHRRTQPRAQMCARVKTQAPKDKGRDGHRGIGAS